MLETAAQPPSHIGTTFPRCHVLQISLWPWMKLGRIIKIRKLCWQLCSPPPSTTVPLNSVIQLMPVMWGGKQMPSKMILLVFHFNSSPHSSGSAELRACSACCWSLPAHCLPALFSTHCSYICTYLPTPQMWSLALRHPSSCEGSLSLCSCFAWLVHSAYFCPV